MVTKPCNLVVVALGGRFVMRPLEVVSENCHLEGLGPEEVSIALETGDFFGAWAVQGGRYFGVSHDAG
jgi:hypothetical protein